MSAGVMLTGQAGRRGQIGVGGLPPRLPLPEAHSGEIGDGLLKAT